jgi:hypothetical protein
MPITSLQARAVIAAGAAKADEIGVPMNIAVLDGGGHLKAFARMDGALLVSIDVALKKGKTAVLFGMNSEAVGEFCKPGARPLAGRPPMTSWSSSRAAFRSGTRPARSSAASASPAEPSIRLRGGARRQCRAARPIG